MTTPQQTSAPYDAAMAKEDEGAMYEAMKRIEQARTRMETAGMTDPRLNHAVNSLRNASVHLRGAAQELTRIFTLPE